MAYTTHLPNFLCIGAQKSATSWLNEVLKLHPQIWLPPVKELHFFDHMYVPENQNWTKGHIQSGIKQSLYWYCNNLANKDNFDIGFVKYLASYISKDMFTEKWYKRIYRRGHLKNMVRGDITPEYSTIPLEGVEYVKELLGEDLKLIYIIRDPVSRGLSQFKMNISRSPNLNPEKMSEQDWKDRFNTQLPVIKNRGNYEEYIPRWESVFDSENILYIPYKSIRENPVEVVNTTCKFLGVKEGQLRQNELNKTVHKTKEIKLPAFIKELIEPELTSQYQYLESRFGEDFISNI